MNNLKEHIKKVPVLRSTLVYLYNKLHRIYVLFKHGFWILPKYRWHYNMSGVVTSKNIDFMKEPEFVRATKAGQDQYAQPDPNFDGWVRHLNLWAAYHANQLDGDFVECGVWRAGTAKANLTYIDFQKDNPRKYYLFDTFQGLDEKYASAEACDTYEELFEQDVYSLVAETFKDYPNVEIVRGSIPETLSDVSIEKVAYLHIDMNCVLPEIEALKFFWPKMVTGGVIVLDDYGWGGVHAAQKEAQDEFAASVGVKIFTLPTGQGLIIKP